MRKIDEMYEYIIKNYRPAEPILISDPFPICTHPDELKGQLDKLCDEGRLMKYDEGVYYIPKKSLLKTPIGPNADAVARKLFVGDGRDVYGFYTGHTFLNQVGISNQVPRVVEITSNKANGDSEEVYIKERPFHIYKSRVEITKENAPVLQLLELLENLRTYTAEIDEEVTERIRNFVRTMDICREDIDKYMPFFSASVEEYLQRLI